MIQHHLQITVCNSPEEAVADGYVYRAPAYQSATLENVVVVKNGAKEGNSTADLIFVDENGQRHVVMLTSRLLKLIPAFGPDNEGLT